jgi:hypothetical protein
MSPARTPPIFALGVAAALGACGAPAAEPRTGRDTGDEGLADGDRDEASLALAPLQVPGSRVTLSIPATATRVPHTLRWRDEDRALSIQVSDATVEPGSERAVAEAGFAQVRADAAGEVGARPVSYGRGTEGLEIDVAIGRQARLHVLTVWNGGAMARIAITHRSMDTRLAARIIDTVRFDPDAPIDPRSALSITCVPPDGLSVVLVSNEQLLLRSDGRTVPFPSSEPLIDVIFASFDDARPTDDRARGALLGRRFAGLTLEPPQVTRLEGGSTPGFALTTTTVVDGVPLFVYGAYLEMADGALLVRASVAADRAEAWRPRFDQLTRTLH